MPGGRTRPASCTDRGSEPSPVPLQVHLPDLLRDRVGQADLQPDYVAVAGCPGTRFPPATTTGLSTQR
jgi:hypothetical protein